MPAPRSASWTTRPSPGQTPAPSHIRTISTAYRLGPCIPSGPSFKSARSTNSQPAMAPIRTPVQTSPVMSSCCGSSPSGRSRASTSGSAASCCAPLLHAGGDRRILAVPRPKGSARRATMTAVPSRNIKFVSHSDLAGRGDGVQIMVHRGHAHIGHGFSNGITTVDVRDARNPKVVDFIACPPGTRAFHLQTHDDLLLAVNAPSVWTMQEFQNDKAYFAGSPADRLKDQSRFTAGIRVYDISRPGKPNEIGFMPVDGLGPHRLWYTGGRYAYASIHFADFTDHIFAVIDLSDPTKPEVAGRFWLPGMWRAGGETPTWRTGKRYALHHALVAGKLAYAAWRDGGLSVLDISAPE